MEAFNFLLSSDIAIVMIAIFFVILFVILLELGIQTPNPKSAGGHWLPELRKNSVKRSFEIYALSYTFVWISAFAVVIVLQLYETFDESSYMYLCVTLALPFLLQPLLYALPGEETLPIYQRYSFKANLWLLIFSYIGSYWYTHYFYSVLGAKYTFPSWRLNNVPIALYFAAYFYFITYHTISNMILRKIESRYLPGYPRTLLFWTVVFAFSYFTAFMETFSISSFPYYSFDDRFMVYTVGSAFYGIYFIVSFPVFYRMDELKGVKYTIYQTIMDSFGASMIVLCLLDFGRLLCQIELSIPGKMCYLYKP
mmetsp:Transcript_35536/g.36208  ORF Transcript_35536/g.36208 Transcript_35536/m.36208 type:complete len:310 (+) Transcript_35536:84-1013(+)